MNRAILRLQLGLGRLEKRIELGLNESQHGARGSCATTHGQHDVPFNLESTGHEQLLRVLLSVRLPGVSD